MIPLNLHMDADGAFKDTPDFKHGMLTDLAFLQNGTESGKPSIALRARLDDGTVIILETTWALLYNGVNAFRAGHGEPA